MTSRHLCITAYKHQRFEYLQSYTSFYQQENYSPTHPLVDTFWDVRYNCKSLTLSCRSCERHSGRAVSTSHLLHFIFLSVKRANIEVVLWLLPFCPNGKQ